MSADRPAAPRRRFEAFAGSAFAMVVAGVGALLTHQPWLFPSLGRR